MRFLFRGRLFYELLRRERRENGRLRRERDEWRDKFLQKVNATPLFTVPVKTEPVTLPPVGQSAKNAFLARNGEPATPSAEEILAQAEKAQR